MIDAPFWQEVIDAYGHVAANNDLEITVSRQSLEAKVSFVPLQNPGESAILILIRQTHTKSDEPTFKEE